MTTPRTEKDLWVEMAIREISTQAHFAEISYKNIDIKVDPGTDLVFSSIHSFLSHSANVSKMLKASDVGDSSKTIGGVLGISENSKIHNRDFRNHLEHYDERLKTWIGKKGSNVTIGTYNIGPKSALDLPNIVLVSHYDPYSNIFTFVDEDFDIGELFEEVKRIKSMADKWVGDMLTQRISPPFMS